MKSAGYSAWFQGIVNPKGVKIHFCISSRIFKSSEGLVFPSPSPPQECHHCLWHGVCKGQNLWWPPAPVLSWNSQKIIATVQFRFVALFSACCCAFATRLWHRFYLWGQDLRQRPNIVPDALDRVCEGGIRAKSRRMEFLRSHPSLDGTLRVGMCFGRVEPCQGRVNSCRAELIRADTQELSGDRRLTRTQPRWKGQKPSRQLTASRWVWHSLVTAPGWVGDTATGGCLLLKHEWNLWFLPFWYYFNIAYV